MKQKMVSILMLFGCMVFLLGSCSRSEEVPETHQSQNLSDDQVTVNETESEPEDEGITQEVADLKIFYGRLKDPLDSNILLGEFYDGVVEDGLEVPEISGKHMTIYSPYNGKRIEIGFKNIGNNRIVAVNLEIEGGVSCDNSMDCLLFFMPLLSQYAGLTEYYNQKFSATTTLRQ